MKKVLPTCSALFGAFFIFVYAMRPDWAAALTIFPAWAWLVFLLLAFTPPSKNTSFLALAMWLIFTILFVEEPRSFFRGEPDEAATDALRCITINCSGSTAAIEDALVFDPDIVLLQESPSEAMLAEFLQSNSFSFVHGLDTSILVKGPNARLRRVAENVTYLTCDVVTEAGMQLRVTSLRLKTSQPRIDLWRARCWSSQSRIRRTQCEQMRVICDTNVPDNYFGPAIIFGGDFNVPQGDAVFRELKGKLSDSFRAGGMGNCNTITSTYPLLRIDQIWASPTLRCFNAFAKGSDHTDHLFYVADFRRVK